MTPAPLPLALDPASGRKARGAFFTPEPVARFIADWALRSASDSVLEPSCGEAVFLLAAAARQRRLCSGGAVVGRLSGVELHSASAQAARVLLAGAGAQGDIVESDFFTVEPTPTFDAVIGNPPFVRYQDFAGSNRAGARAAALRAGVRLTGLASSWAAFTVHAAQFLAPGGRLGLVLPAELLSVNYASQVREFLMRRFGRVRLVAFTERVFPGVLEEVVLLLAEGSGGTDCCELVQVDNADGLARLDRARTSMWMPGDVGGKWTTALLPAAASDAYARLVADPAFTTLHSWGETTLGMVTGANRFFALSPDRAAGLGLAETELLPLSPPGSRHLRGLTFGGRARKALGIAGAATLLFRPPGDPGPAARAYIGSGEATGVHEAYKCRVRTPWWRVPLLPPAHLLLTYMNADTPRLTVNAAGAHHLNSVHGVYLRDDTRDLGRRVLPLASLTSLTLLGAELVGRAYGGGMLKIEPREADHLPILAPTVAAQLTGALQAVRPRVAAHLRAGRLRDAVREVDTVVFVDGLGVAPERVAELEDAHIELSARRRARGLRPSDRVSPHADVQAHHLKLFGEQATLVPVVGSG